MPEEQTKALSLIAAYEFATTHGLAQQAAEIRNMAIDGFNHPSSVRRGYVVHLLESHGFLDEFKEKHWAFGKTRKGEVKRRFYLRLRDKHQRLLAGSDPQDESGMDTEEETQDEQSFRFESDLRDFLAHNLTLVEPGLRLYDPQGQSGVEFPVEGGRIDILAVDRNEKFVVIELKLSRGRNRTIGQLLYYMGWIDEKLGRAPCCGMIIAREIPDDLLMAIKRVTGVSLYRYNISMSVQAVFSG
jgi:hypothetical protein